MGPGEAWLNTEPFTNQYLLSILYQFAGEFAGRTLRKAARALHNRNDRYSLILLFRWASWSFLMSSGDNCGRSILIVSLYADKARAFSYKIFTPGLSLDYWT